MADAATSSSTRRRLWIVLGALFTLGIVIIYVFDVSALAKHSNDPMSSFTSRGRGRTDGVHEEQTVAPNEEMSWRTRYENLVEAIAKESKEGNTKFTAEWARAQVVTPPPDDDAVGDDATSRAVTAGASGEEWGVWEDGGEQQLLSTMTTTTTEALTSEEAAATATATTTQLGKRCKGDPKHKPAMTSRERSTMLKYVKGNFPGSKWKDGEAVYLEWGSGGSTATYGTAAKKAYSVEHAVSWCAVVSNWTDIKCLANSNRWKLYCHDPKTELRKWGFPRSPLHKVGYPAFYGKMRKYVQAPARFEENKYDVVLIDGRHRIACAYAIVPYLHAGSIVAWHDFTEQGWNAMDSIERRQLTPAQFPRNPGQRQYSKGAARLFQKVEHVDALAIFRLNPTLVRHLQLMAKKK